MGEGEARLFVYQEGSTFVALPLLLRSVATLPGLEGELLRDATSVYGYPGPFVSRAAPPEAMLGRFGAALRATARYGRRGQCFLRLNPLLDQASWLEGLGILVGHGPTVSMDFQSPPEMQRASYRANHRRDLQRLHTEGFIGRVDYHLATFASFVRLYYETMRRVGAGSWYFFPESYFALLREFLGARIRLVVCERSGEIAAAALFLVCGGIAQYHLGDTRDAWLKQAPMKLVFDTTQEALRSDGVEVLHLGGWSRRERGHPLRLQGWLLQTPTPISYLAMGCPARRLRTPLPRARARPGSSSIGGVLSTLPAALKRLVVIDIQP